MPRPLDVTSSRLKIDRAHERRNALNTEFLTFLSSHPYDITAHFDRDKSEVVVEAIVRKNPDPMWSVAVGEILHDIRSSLDHLVWQLVGANRGRLLPVHVPRKSPWTKLQYPLVGKAGEFTNRKGTWLNGVSPAAQKMIESTQPYAGRHNSRSRALRLLRDLSNIDKHRMLHLLGGISEERGPGSDIRVEDAMVEAGRLRSGPFEDGAELGRFAIRRVGKGKPKVYVEPNLTFDIAFDKRGPGKGRSVMIVLMSTTHEVASVISDFEAAFG
ncbi:MAG TPA: hypothetical protein VMR89_11410 [Actinomycetota bacterium]|nr:hypothetical protein [Actinomycetota bacterium]